jgi:integrase
VGRQMARKVEQLSTAKVKHAKPGLHHDGGGLYLQVTTGKDRAINKSWLFRFKLNGRERWMGLGPLGTIGLGEARAAAAVARQRVLAGDDPIDVRDAKRSQSASAGATMTFERCAVAYMAAHEKSWRSAVHRRQWMQSLRDYVYPPIGKTPVDQINTEAVLRVLQPIWHDKPETANRVRSRIELVLDYAKGREWRGGENPARWRGHLKQLLAKRQKVEREHHEAMPYSALPGFLVRLREIEAVRARGLEFAILTAARAGEVIGATWSEIDLDHAVWTIPAGRMKGGKAHRVPLGARAIEIVEEARGLGLDPFLVFPNSKGRRMDTGSLLRTAKALGANVTTHGFRATFKTWANETTSYPNDAIEISLAHAVGNKVEQAYQRGDLLERRRQLMNAWAGHCASPAANNVVRLQAIT